MVPAATDQALPCPRYPQGKLRQHRVALRPADRQVFFFETLATNGETLLAVAAVNDDNGPEITQLEMACGQGYMDPRCPQVFQSRRNWAQMVLGVQFTSFPQLQIDPAYQ